MEPGWRSKRHDQRQLTDHVSMVTHRWVVCQRGVVGGTIFRHHYRCKQLRSDRWPDDLWNRRCLRPAAAASQMVSCYGLVRWSGFSQ